MIVAALGITGMIALVVCYVSMLSGRLNPDSYKFLFGNLVGGFCLMLNGFLSGILLAYPILNVVWTVGTVIQIYRKWKRK